MNLPVELYRVRCLPSFYILVCQQDLQSLQYRDTPTPVIIRPRRAIVHTIRIPLVNAILVCAQHDRLVTLTWYDRNNRAL